MSDTSRDKRGRFVCQKCGRNVARIWTSHRRTESDHHITYPDGQTVFEKLPKDGGIAAYCRDEYLCFSCCFNEPEPGEIDERAELDPGEVIKPYEPQERVELEEGAEVLADDDNAESWDDLDSDEVEHLAPTPPEDQRPGSQPQCSGDTCGIVAFDNDDFDSHPETQASISWGR